MTDRSVLLELPLRRLQLHDPEGGADWVELMPILMLHYRGLTPDGYWNLTGHEALSMALHLVKVKRVDAAVVELLGGPDDGAE